MSPPGAAPKGHSGAQEGAMERKTNFGRLTLLALRTASTAIGTENARRTGGF